MKEECVFLNNYPLEEHYTRCEQYIESHIDWDKRCEEIKQKDVSYFDVSDVVSLFPHLELDEDYKLLCYLGREYHGIWGRIAAIKNGANLEPEFDSQNEWVSTLLGGKHFELPESAASPMEVIYHDGTDEGRLEAILCAQFFEVIPYANFAYRHKAIIMDNPPPNLSEDWNTIVNIEDWTPRRVNNSIIVFWRKIEDGIESSDGRDRIYLRQFNFENYLGFYHAFKMNNSRSMYRNQIDDDKRYNENRHCCVFTESSVLVAIES